MSKASLKRVRRFAITTACLALVAGIVPIACSSKAPAPEGVCKGAACESACSTSADCSPGEHCAADNKCTSVCTSAGNECGTGYVCGSNGHCTSSTGGTAGSSGTGGTGAVITVPDSGTDDDGSLDPDAACGIGTATATLTPVSMVVMFDRSGSMIMNEVAPGVTRWAMASAALTAFFQDPTAADIAVALRFFPHDQPAVGCTDDGCDAAACSQILVPLNAVPTTPLPTLTADPAPTDTHEAALVQSIVDALPMTGNNTGGTPTSVALDGAVTWAGAYQAAHPRPETQTVVVFVTDGEPNGCDEDIDNIAAIASTALAASGVTTYVIGLTGSNEADLTTIATAGGGQAFFVADGPTGATELVTALKAIQGSALDCTFPFPEADDGGRADPSRINVDFTPGGGSAMRLTQVTGVTECGTTQSWYYDNPTAPTTITLCDAACTVARADPNASLAIQIGCRTELTPPH